MPAKTEATLMEGTGTAPVDTESALAELTADGYFVPDDPVRVEDEGEMGVANTAPAEPLGPEEIVEELRGHAERMEKLIGMLPDGTGKMVAQRQRWKVAAIGKIQRGVYWATQAARRND